MRAFLVLAAALALAASWPPVALWAPWIVDAALESVRGRGLGLRHAWAPLARAPTAPRPVRVLDGAALCAGGARPTVDLREPVLIRNATRAPRPLSPEALAMPPLADVVVDYFYDATRARHLVPDARAPLGAVVANASRGAPHKVASQRVVSRTGCCAGPGALEAFLAALAPPCALAPLAPATPLGNRLGAAALDLRLLTVPVFVSGGARGARTDLHAEPVASVALQLHGSKDWILVPAAASRRLRPRPAPDGRAYFRAGLGDADLRRVPERYAVSTRPGDALWVPPWTWHAVTYDGGLSVAASLFHFRPLAFLAHAPLALAVLPNLAKELVGLKTQ